MEVSAGHRKENPFSILPMTLGLFLKAHRPYRGVGVYAASPMTIASCIHALCASTSSSSHASVSTS